MVFVRKLVGFVDKFPKQKILVLGDLMVDKFVWGKVSRISPEAPVPVVAVENETYAFGGAGNVANNLKSLDAQVHIIGVIGNDIVGNQLKQQLKDKHISIEGIVCDNNRPTITKTRIIAHHQQVVRVDKELKGKLSLSFSRELNKKLDTMVPCVNAIIISDYGKGVVNQSVLKKAISLARKYDIPITVDPKIENFLNYKRVSCITPNQSEAIAGMRSREITEDKDIIELGNKILKRLNSKSVLITRGEKGMTLFESEHKVFHIPTRAKEVFDVTGAGDTVIAAFTLALAAGANLPEAAELSNFAAGIVVGKLGTATVSPNELKTVISRYRK